MVISLGRFGAETEHSNDDHFADMIYDDNIKPDNIGHRINNEPTSQSSTRMRDKAYEICRKYLSGEWNNISSKDMIFKTVTGGLSNLLFYCSLPATHTPVTGEPSQVLLRMYGQLLDKKDTKITDSVITMLLSERNLGPKLYGIFPGGRLEEYIPARAMICTELKNPDYSAIIARKLALVHNLNVPINKEPTWLPDTINNWLKEVRKIPFSSLMSPIERELISFDFEKEIKILFKILSKCQSPVVFCHNDLQEGNILIPSNEQLLQTAMGHENGKQNGNDNDNLECTNYKLEDHIVFIDFEFCAYNYRGFDLGNHFVERMFDYSNPEWPHFFVYENEYPDDNMKQFFIEQYLKQSKELKYDETVDNVDNMIMEADFYALASHFLWSLWSINNARNSSISFGYWEYGKTRLTFYQQHKEYLIKKYCLKPVDLFVE